MSPTDTPPSSPTLPVRAPLKPLDQALAELLAQAAPLPAVDSVSTFEADGRVLAQDLVSGLDVPAHLLPPEGTDVKLIIQAK